MQKSITTKISIQEPDEDQLIRELAGREISPELLRFLKTILKTKKWTRKINIPSGFDDVAAVLVFTAAIKEGGIEIFSELHVFLAGQVLVEMWRVCGEEERKALMPKEALSAVEIKKVRVDDCRVSVEFLVPIEGGFSDLMVREFDFSAVRPSVEIVPHPLLFASPASLAD